MPSFRVKSAGALLLAFVVLLGCCHLEAKENRRAGSYLGFDRNEYPGDANLKTLRQTFSYAGYWLNNPPGATKNSWVGHRTTVESAGFGFLVLFNGRLYSELKSVTNATRLAQSDAKAAVIAAKREGFPLGTVIFLDQEQGGRMLPEQKAYIYGWVDGVIAAGFRAGIYCSGMVSPDENKIVTAQDIREHAGEGARATRNITYWVTNDACPPAPGCAFSQRPPSPAQSGVAFAEVWQFAQSPRRKDVTAHCTNYSRDENCYAPGTGPAQGLHVDVNTATSPDPSHGRTRYEKLIHRLSVTGSFRAGPQKACPACEPETGQARRKRADCESWGVPSQEVSGR